MPGAAPPGQRKLTPDISVIGAALSPITRGLVIAFQRSAADRQMLSRPRPDSHGRRLPRRGPGVSALWGRLPCSSWERRATRTGAARVLLRSKKLAGQGGRDRGAKAGPPPLDPGRKGLHRLSSNERSNGRFDSSTRGSRASGLCERARGATNAAPIMPPSAPAHEAGEYEHERRHSPHVHGCERHLRLRQ